MFPSSAFHPAIASNLLQSSKSSVANSFIILLVMFFLLIYFQLRFQIKFLLNKIFELPVVWAVVFVAFYVYDDQNTL